ncbi:NAD-dependent malic enzyme [Hoeflea poritis]|uniref:NAD-dependent malic enzyme n=1 Tax=Hoeflea poritis TaxID=2993659 RepID=A0ABT4VME6_9HYPH|nr:NAD-dependent malic enzyme [Hoeflea poritis]MDA4845886.1 NAD-dependent malic enzyme [Hoeflea poritis]
MYSGLAKVTGRGTNRKVSTTARGYEVLRDPALNKGLAFVAEERAALGLEGLLPDAVVTDLEPQLDWAYRNYCAQPTDLDKHIYAWRLHDNNSVLFFALIQRHLLEMLPVVYDPTVGEAIENYSEIWTRPRGVFLSVDAIDTVEQRLANFGASADDIDLLVATDAEEILGIGDWGANGVDISIGKLAVYSAAAGIDPHRVIPVMLDAGTNNEKLLHDPLYTGARRARVSNKEYDALIDAYVAAARKLFPNAMLHWEDFGSTNCRRILDRYRGSAPMFNDDMQGTGAITMAGLFNAVELSRTTWRDQRIVVLGGGTAGCGIVDQARDEMVRHGLSADDATARIWIVDLPGLLTTSMSDRLLDYQRPYVRPDDEVADWTRTPCDENRKAALRWPAMAGLRAEAANGGGIIDLATVVERVKPTILIGTSTTPGMFTEDIVRTMAAAVERPIIFPLSNPTHLAEATPKQLLTWSDGNALVATGSPFEDVTHKGVTHRIGQANNAALYPGLGLGAIVARASKITDEMILAAAHAVADEANLAEPGASLLPSNGALRTTSSVVATAVVRMAIEQGVATADIDDPIEAVRISEWWPVYCPVSAI